MQAKSSRASSTLRGVVTLPLHGVDLQQRYQQHRHDVDDLVQRIELTAGGVLARVADGAAGYRRLPLLVALAPNVTPLYVLLCVVP